VHRESMLRKIIRSVSIALLLQVFSVEQSASAECFNTSNNEPRTLNGVLKHQIFPGPPNYKNIRQGDHPEPAYILSLPRKICIIDDDGFADPDILFDTVHLIQTDQIGNMMRKLVGGQVTVFLKNRFPSHTGHHHAPLVALVEDIEG
jgi:hypothetical protein